MVGSARIRCSPQSKRPVLCRHDGGVPPTYGDGRAAGLRIKRLRPFLHRRSGLVCGVELRGL